MSFDLDPTKQAQEVIFCRKTIKTSFITFLKLEVLRNGRHLTDFPSGICQSIEKCYILCGEREKKKFLKYSVNDYIFGKVDWH